MTTTPCLYCAQPAVIGPCDHDGESCTHRVTCAACGKWSLLSVNLALLACPYGAGDLPLFPEIA